MRPRAQVAELVDALDLGSSGATRESSSLSLRTIYSEPETERLAHEGGIVMVARSDTADRNPVGLVMDILLYTENLMTRAQLEGTWKNAGARVFVKEAPQSPDLIVVDLTLAGIIDRISELRGQYPDAEILAFGPHVDGEVFKQAKAAGASGLAARGKIVQRVLSKIEPDQGA